MKKTFLMFLFIISTNLSAWWATGHEMVCDEAYKLLTPSALKSIDPLIEEHGSFGRACLWADWIKSDRKNTRSWHYINLSDSEQDTYACLLYTSPSPRDATLSRMPSSA